jgi:hypothetical protein
MDCEDAKNRMTPDGAPVPGGTGESASELRSTMGEGTSASSPLPKPKGTGLVVVIAALLLLLVAGVAGAMLLVPVLRGGKGTVTTDAAATKARVETAIGVMKALRTNDLEGIRPFLVDSANKAITDAQWAEVAGASQVSSATFSPTIWSDDTTASVDYTIDGAAGTMTFAPNRETPNTVTMTEVGADGTLVYDIQLTQVKTGWRASVLTPRAQPFKLDAAFVKSLVTTQAP